MSRPANIGAAVFTTAVLASDYAAFGFWTMLIFTSGFLGGFLFWLAFPAGVQWPAIKVPYFLALALFGAHRFEEYATGFFDRLAAITGVAKPEVASVPVVVLLALSVGAWLLVPVLMSRATGTSANISHGLSSPRWA